MVTDVDNLISWSEKEFGEYEMANLPTNLQRNSLNHYYLSVYPSIGQMNLKDSDSELRYPNKISSIYVHTPFCSDICDFCSYLVKSTGRNVPNVLELTDIEELGKNNVYKKIEDYFELLKKEIFYHSSRTKLEINYIYFGGGSPNLIPYHVLNKFLSFLKENGFLNQSTKLMGTIELHPEFFNNQQYAGRFLDMLCSHGIKRVSIGYQFSENDKLEKHNRRHTNEFISDAVKLIRSKNIQFNLDLMYGMPDQTLKDWGNTLLEAEKYHPDSISTYFLFTSPETELYRKIQKKKVNLPSFRTIQVMHIMAQKFLSDRFHELPNDFYASRISLYGDPDEFTQYALPSSSSSLPIGAGSYGYFNNTQFCNFFDLSTYKASIDKGLSPVWRSYTLNEEQQVYRDIQFSFKNDPLLSLRLFNEKYKIDITQDSRFSHIFKQLNVLKLIIIDKEKIKLTPKGKLCVEEITCLFHDPSITFSNDYKNNKMLQKHNFAPTYDMETVPSHTSTLWMWKNKRNIGIAAAVSVGLLAITVAANNRNRCSLM